jgi:hypothetical protein
MNPFGIDPCGGSMLRVSRQAVPGWYRTWSLAEIEHITPVPSAQ